MRVELKRAAFVVAVALGAGACGGSPTGSDASAAADVPVATAAPSTTATSTNVAVQPTIAVPTRDDVGVNADSAANEAASRDMGDGAARVDAPPATPAVIGEVSNEGVLAASVIILSNGDLETAIAEGIVTEAEAEAALVAIEQGTLGEYAE